MRTFLTLWFLALATGCADSHDPPPTCDDGTCPGGLVCLSPPDVPNSACVIECDAEMIRCGPGMLCKYNRGLRVCWPGGDAPEGRDVGLDTRPCQRGLAGRADYEAEPLTYICEPLCETDADCRAGETCADGLTCTIPCTNPAGEPCAEGSTCVDSYCVNARRFARIDCDGDGTADCGVNGACDDEVPGRMCIGVTEDL